MVIETFYGLSWPIMSKMLGAMTDLQAEDPKTEGIEIPEAVGVFDSFESLQQTFYDLRMVGFSRFYIRLLAMQEMLEKSRAKPIGALGWATCLMSC